MTLAVAVLALGMVAVEAAFRIVDRYSLTSVRLVRLPAPAVTLDTVAASYVDRLPIVRAVDRAWFALNPVYENKPSDPDLEKRYWSHPGQELPAVYEWNEAHVRLAICDEPPAYETIFKPLGDIFAFVPLDGRRLPQFRFLRGAHLPSGLNTNNFGWRGPDVALERPKGTIRIAFVGASTTIDPHGDFFSYPDYVRKWLNVWTAGQHPEVNVEVINAGREGVNSSGIAAIVRDEVAPVDPDLVVYYEGSNQFWPAQFIEWPKDAAPRRQTVVPPQARWALEGQSALMVRLKGFVDRWSRRWREPDKPGLTVKWPASLMERDPQLDHSELPLSLPTILKDFDTMRAALEPAGGRLGISSFVWCVVDGMRLDPATNAGVYQYLNTTFWPFSYAHMRRMADFQNRVFEKYAKEHDVDFLDVAHDYPLDPRLFADAIHMVPLGIKLLAWTTFQRLVPLIDQRIAAGEWPRPPRLHLSAHPAFDQPTRRLVQIPAIRASCEQRTTPASPTREEE
jgi:hypothetical protein